jgi:SAM-dependent methyltransferase
VKLEELQSNWDRFALTDPLWSICTEPGKRGNRWDPQEFFRTGEVEVALLLDRARDLGVDEVGGSALDFGCGVGRLTLALCERFDEVCGVDISPSMIEIAEGFNLYPDKCRYVVNSAPDLEMFEDARFDFICTSITLQHMDPDAAKGYLREFVRLLKPGGLLVFQVPDSPDMRYLGNRLRRVAPGFALRIYRALRYGRKRPRMEMHEIPRSEVTDLMGECGARVLDVVKDDSARQWISYRYYVTRD